MADEKTYGYGKRPLWQWILIYVVIGAVVYGLVYYFVFAKRGYNTSPNSYMPQAPVQQNQNPSSKNY